MSMGLPSEFEPQLWEKNRIPCRFERFRSDFGHNDRAECSAEGKRDGVTAGILMSSVGMRMPRSD